MSITKTKKKNKDGVFQYRVRVSYQTADGSYKQREKAVYGLQQAKEIEYQLKQQSGTETTRISISDLIEEYLHFKQYEVRENTMRTSSSRIGTYILPFIGDVLLNKLTPKILMDWKLSIENLGLSHKTKKNAYGELTSIFKYAVKMDYLQVNPLDKIGNFKSGEIVEKKIQVYTPEEFNLYIEKALQDAVETRYYDFYVFFNIAFYMGMRKGEIHSFRWSNIKDDVIFIRKSTQQKIKGKYLETQTKNTGSIRDIKIPKKLFEILAQHKSRQMLQPNFHENCYICGFDKPLADTSIDNKNRAIAKSAELHRIRIHDFRHTHASILIDAGVPITEIARRLGHKNIKETLNTYAHFFPKQEDQAIRALDNL